MQNLELSNYGVAKLNEVEMIDTDGGGGLFEKIFKFEGSGFLDGVSGNEHCKISIFGITVYSC